MDEETQQIIDFFGQNADESKFILQKNIKELKFMNFILLIQWKNRSS